jgi:hypothetical protein
MGAISYTMDCCSKSSESVVTTADTSLSLPPTAITSVSMPLGRQAYEEDQDHRRKVAYKWYKHFAKPTKASMYSIVDHYATANDSDITRQDVDILPWNLEETEVIKEAMKSLKKTEQNDKKKGRKKVKKQKERDEEDRVSAEELRIRIKVEEEHKRRREERRCKREAAEKKSTPEVDVQDKKIVKDTTGIIEEGRRLERAFLWYQRMATPSRTEFKQRLAAVESIDITPEDIDLLPWNFHGRVVNIAKMNAMIRESLLQQ